MGALATTTLTSLGRVERGVADAERTAAFYGWLLDVPVEGRGGGGRIACSNGDLAITSSAKPVSIGWSASGAAHHGTDPDGVPVDATPPSPAPDARTTSVALDHVRLNCGDLAATAAFYARLGLSVTWAGGPGGDVGVDSFDWFAAVGEAIPSSVDWMHVSTGDGYLSLSQADWEEFGTGKPASGPPRFMHIGLAVTDLASVIGRLDRHRVDYSRVDGPLATQIYLSDPDGDSALGQNIELIEYRTAGPRSGRAA